VNAASSLAAEALAARLPPLLVAAERVAATVAQGAHGRRRVGQGDRFWQFRAFVAGDSAARIDWRQSARGERLFIRESEWEAAQTVSLWRDGGPGMRWRSSAAMPEKIERAELLLLALASLLLRGGEQVRLMAPGARSIAGRGGVMRLARALANQTISNQTISNQAMANQARAGEPVSDAAFPPEEALPLRGRAVLIGDMVAPLPAIAARIAALAARAIRGHVLMVLDPAEAVLPYAGRVRFEGMGAQERLIVPRVEGIRDAYAARLAAHQSGLAAICAAAGWGFGVHRTDAAPALALLSLYQALSADLRR
jgi:uncharacterized protein (DUF58 family)